MNKRSIDYFKECRRDRAAIAAGGYWFRAKKIKLETSLSFSEQRKMGINKKYKSVLRFPISQEPLSGPIPMPSDWERAVHSMKVIIPKGGLLDANDNPVPAIEYHVSQAEQQLQEACDWMNKHWSDLGTFQVFDGKIIRTQEVYGYSVHGVFPQDRIKELLNRTPEDERSVATDSE